MFGGCPLTGRQVEMESLGGALARAAAGEGGVVVLRGDAGVGKTRLLDELVGMAGQGGALALRGRAWAMHTRLAYALLVDALGSHLRKLLPRDRERLVDDLPELDNLFIELPRRTLVPLGDPELETTRLFEAFCRLVERLAGSQTVVLALDDVQWADHASIEMLHYLCRNVGRSRLLVALTVRVGEPDANPGLDELLRSLGHAGLLAKVEVNRLSDEDVLTMARLTLEGDLAPSLQSLLIHRTRGMPFLVEVLLRSLLASGQLRRHLLWQADASAADHLPNEVRELAGFRLARIGATDRSILEMLAIDGGGTSPSELAAACEVEPGVVAQCLDRLGRERLVRLEGGEGEPRFFPAHPLLQQALLDALGAGARPRLHLQLARSLERIRGGDLGRLARHYVGAGAAAASPRALEVVRAAAGHAAMAHAPTVAGTFYAAAIELARALGREVELPDLLGELGDARSADGDPASAAASWSEAAKLYEARGERGRAGALTPKIALAKSTRGQSTEALELLRAAANGASPELGVRLAEAEVMIRDRIGDLETLDLAVDELRRLAEESGQVAVAITAKRTEAWLCVSRVECLRAWELLSEALDGARAVGDPLVIFQVLRERLFLAMSLGDLDSVERHAIEAGELARTQLRSAPLESIAETGRLAVDWARGDVQRAAERLPRVFEMALRAGDQRFAIGALYGNAQVAAIGGDAETARACLEEARRQGAHAVTETRIEVQRLVAEGELKLLEGDHQGGISALTEACGPLPGRLMRSEFPVYCLSRLGRAYVVVGRLDDARKIVRNLEGGGPLAEAHAARLRGSIKGADGVADLERALHGFRRLGIAPEIAHCGIELADLLAATRRDDAVELAREAAELAAKIGDSLTLRRAQAHLSAQRSAPARPRSRTPRRTVEANTPSLSAREREVAVLIARSLTNQEIARSLHISAHTVATHIKRMYERLGLSSRVELTRYVISHQLDEE